MLQYIKGRGFSGGTSGKGPACQCKRHKRCGFNPWIRKIPWRRAWQPTPVPLPGESHGQRSLAGYTVHEVAKSRTWLKRLSMHAHNKGHVFFWTWAGWAGCSAAHYKIVGFCKPRAPRLSHDSLPQRAQHMPILSNMKPCSGTLGTV